jgi:hypothetical protein
MIQPGEIYLADFEEMEPHPVRDSNPRHPACEAGKLSWKL